MASGTAVAALYAPPHEWIVNGPGGVYGVFSYHTQYSFIHIGPFGLVICLGFRAARVAFLSGIGVCVVLVFGAMRSRRFRLVSALALEMVLIWVVWQTVVGNVSIYREQTATAFASVRTVHSPENESILARCKQVDTVIGVCGFISLSMLLLANSIGVAKATTVMKYRANHAAQSTAPKVADSGR